MGLLDRLDRDMVKATKSRDSERLGVIRFLRSEIKNLEIELGRKPDDTEVVSVLSRVAKRHRESIEQFRQGGRDDLVEKEERQSAIVKEYMPEQLSHDEIAELVDQVIRDAEARGPSDLGRVMGAMMPKVRGRADGSAVKSVVEAKLSEMVNG